MTLSQRKVHLFGKTFSIPPLTFTRRKILIDKAKASTTRISIFLSFRDFSNGISTLHTDMLKVTTLKSPSTHYEEKNPLEKRTCFTLVHASSFTLVK